MAAKIFSLETVTGTTPSLFSFLSPCLKVPSLLYFFSPLFPCIIHKCVNSAYVRYLTWFSSLFSICGLILGKGAGFHYLLFIICTHTKYMHAVPCRITFTLAFTSLKEIQC